MKITEINCLTGVEIVRDMTEEELAAYELRRQNALYEQAEAEAKATARQTILDRLGITAEEARILLG
jgi:hypothetical protein